MTTQDPTQPQAAPLAPPVAPPQPAAAPAPQPAPVAAAPPPAAPAPAPAAPLSEGEYFGTIGPDADVAKMVLETRSKHSAVDVVQAFKRSSLGHLQLIPVDEWYWALPLDTWQAVIAHTSDAKATYDAQDFDCDDFARCQAALPSLFYRVNSVAQIYDFSGRHSYNAVLVHSSVEGDPLKVRVVEPQQARLLEENELGKRPYRETNGLVIV